ncbi:MAG TPA: hypothetical protein VJL60_05250, partial [Gammaproteobacteria bacterium]|nr:hypothetical protein [Gammaproteobacteria bacterium]
YVSQTQTGFDIEMPLFSPQTIEEESIINASVKIVRTHFNRLLSSPRPPPSLTSSPTVRIAAGIILRWSKPFEAKRRVSSLKFEFSDNLFLDCECAILLEGQLKNLESPLFLSDMKLDGNMFALSPYGKTTLAQTWNTRFYIFGVDYSPSSLSFSTPDIILFNRNAFVHEKILPVCSNNSAHLPIKNPLTLLKCPLSVFAITPRTAIYQYPSRCSPNLSNHLSSTIVFAENNNNKNESIQGTFRVPNKAIMWDVRGDMYKKKNKFVLYLWVECYSNHDQPLPFELPILRVYGLQAHAHEQKNNKRRWFTQICSTDSNTPENKIPMRWNPYLQCHEPESPIVAIHSYVFFILD